MLANGLSAANTLWGAQMTDTIALKPPRKRRNWWKIGFFVMLIAFELAREVAVIGSDQQAQPNASKLVFTFDNGRYITASGRWKRSDGGDRLQPGTVTIECRRDRGQCVEAMVNSIDTSYFAPTLDWFDATFTDRGVRYVNDNAACARYEVVIDTVQKRAFATRERKPNPANPMCKNLEDRIAMELGDGFEPVSDSLKGHSAPLFQIIIGVFKAFDTKAG